MPGQIFLVNFWIIKLSPKIYRLHWVRLYPLRSAIFNFWDSTNKGEKRKSTKWHCTVVRFIATREKSRTVETAKENGNLETCWYNSEITGDQNKEKETSIILQRQILLRALSADSTGQLDVLGHDRDALGVDSAQIGVLEQADQVGFCGFLWKKGKEISRENNAKNKKSQKKEK